MPNQACCWRGVSASAALMSLRGALLIGLGVFAKPIDGQAQWIESKAPNYTVFYREGFESDLAFTRRWMDNAEPVMNEKYGVTAQGYLMSVFLYPEPADDITLTQSGQNVCCTLRNGRMVGTLKLLSRSAAVWKSGHFKSSLRLPKEGDDYHAKVLMSEYIPIGHYAVQDSRPTGGWKYYDAPNWFVQGLQESRRHLRRRAGGGDWPHSRRPFRAPAAMARVVALSERLIVGADRRTFEHLVNAQPLICRRHLLLS